MSKAMSSSRLLLSAAIVSMVVQMSGAEEPKKEPTPVSGRERPELKALDELMSDFLAEQPAPGVALAVAKDGRLVYARGFGYANVEAKQTVAPDSLFRTASISKWLTLAALCRLSEQGKLNFNDQVYEVLKLHPPDEAKFDARWKNITINHLCGHTGGWDRAKSGDPMFKPVVIAREFGVPPPAKQEQIIQHMLGQPLDFDPGVKVVYSNFGYCLLGRVVEAASGKAYDRYVIDELLTPLGVTRTRQGRTLTAADGEVKYYDPVRPTGKGVFPENLDQDVPAPYGAWHLEAMDSHGGWISSAPDLVRFACALGEPERFPAFRGGAFQASFRTNSGHAGALDGTSTLLRREANGVTWCVLFNSHVATDGKKSLVDTITPKLQEAFQGITAWPTGDLFEDLKYTERQSR